MVRHTFSSPGRLDHASRVTWGLPSSTPVASSVSAAHWRQHFVSVGANSHSFDEEFFEEVSHKFRDINSHQMVPGLFDAPFSPSELRRALNLCFDSAVGAHGLPYSVFKTNLPWWQTAVLHFFNLVLSWGVVATPWKRSIVVPVFKCGNPSLATNFRPISLASCCLKIFKHLVHAAHISPLIWMNIKVVFAGVRTLWLGLLSIFSLHVRSRTLTWPSTKPSIPLGSKVLWFGCSTPVCQVKCGS